MQSILVVHNDLNPRVQIYIVKHDPDVNPGDGLCEALREWAQTDDGYEESMTRNSPFFDNSDWWIIPPETLLEFGIEGAIESSFDERQKRDYSVTCERAYQEIYNE